MFDFKKVRFEHDNRIDLLTGAAMQTDFYRNMLRALIVRKRNGGALYMVTVKVRPPTRVFKSGSLAAKKQISEFEDALKLASNLIKKNLRAQDFYTRMAIDGFYILISGSASEESQMVERFKKLFADRSLYQVQSSKLVGDKSATKWLQEVDASFFVSN
mgnify:FL=1